MLPPHPGRATLTGRWREACSPAPAPVRARATRAPDQEEVDEYWNKLISAGATPLQCGWITDQFGITWQIVPRRFIELISDKNPKKVQSVMEAMMKMVKLDVAALQRAYDDA